MPTFHRLLSVLVIVDMIAEAQLAMSNLGIVVVVDEESRGLSYDAGNTPGLAVRNQVPKYRA
jgi:hypothetical protein